MHNRINSALSPLCSPPSSHFHFKEVPIFHKDVPLKQAKPSALAQSHKKSGWWSPELHYDLIQFLALRYLSQLSSAWESWLGSGGGDTSYLCHHPDWFTLTDLAHKRVHMQGSAAQSLLKLWVLSKDVMECAWQSVWQISHDALTKFSTSTGKRVFFSVKFVKASTSPNSKNWGSSVLFTGDWACMTKKMYISFIRYELYFHNWKITIPVCWIFTQWPSFFYL